jgi:hypothetical protein
MLKQIQKFNCLVLHNNKLKVFVIYIIVQEFYQAEAQLLKLTQRHLSNNNSHFDALPLGTMGVKCPCRLII